MTYGEPGRGALEAPHQHDTHCFWDLRDCSWHCATGAPVEALAERSAEAAPPRPPVEPSLVLR